MQIAQALQPRASCARQQRHRPPPAAAAAALAYAPRAGGGPLQGSRSSCRGFLSGPRLTWCHCNRQHPLAAAAADDGEQPDSSSDTAMPQLQQLLQQQQGIDSAAAAQLAAQLVDEVVRAGPARQLPEGEVAAALHFFVGRGMQPAKAVRMLARIGKHPSHSSCLRYWAQTWEPVFAANWQLADGYLAAYQQRCTDAKQRPLKGSESLAALLGDRPSKYPLLKVPDLQQKLAALQHGELGLTAADVGELIASGLTCTGSQATIAAAISWLVQFAGSVEVAVSMLRQVPGSIERSTATLDSKLAALKAAWAGTLQPGQVEQLVRRYFKVFYGDAARYADTATVLRSWFPQPGELWAVLQKAPHLAGTSAASLRATERWMTGPPLGLSRQQFLQLVRERPQAFAMDLSAPLTQHKLAFLAQVGDVPLERALGKHSSYLKSGTVALAGRYFLLLEHGVALPRHADGGIELSYSTYGLPRLLRLLRHHGSAGQLPADDGEAATYLGAWLRDWPETESGRRWAKLPEQ